MVTGKYTHSGPSLVALAPDLGTVAIACNSDVSFYKAATTEHDMTIADVHTSKISFGRDLFKNRQVAKIPPIRVILLDFCRLYSSVYICTYTI